MSLRMVILAAGEGKRLRPLTDDVPKGMVKVAGKPLIDWQIDAASRLGMPEVAVVTGYLADRFPRRACRWYHNPDYAVTNMVESLWCAVPEFQGEMIVSYADVIYEDSVLQALMEAEAPISVVIDLDWRPYWERRSTDPLSDAESLRLDGDQQILEIGQEAATLDEIQGQYVGLMKFNGAGIETLKEVYSQLKGNGVVGKAGRPFRGMHMTDLLQAIVEAGHEVRAVPIRRKWLEIDSTDDYELAQRNVQLLPEGPRILI